TPARAAAAVDAGKAGADADGTMAWQRTDDGKRYREGVDALTAGDYARAEKLLRALAGDADGTLAGAFAAEMAEVAADLRRRGARACRSRALSSSTSGPCGAASTASPSPRSPIRAHAGRWSGGRSPAWAARCSPRWRRASGRRAPATRPPCRAAPSGGAPSAR